MKEKDTKTQQKMPKKGVRVFKAVLNTVINIMIVGVLIISVFVAVMALTSKSNPDGLPNIFGYTLQYVQTNSMSTPSPDGYEGGEFTDKDVIIGRIFDIDNPVEFDVGDIVTFKSKKYDAEGNALRITHRIVDKVEVFPNYYAYQTWGDNRELAEVPDQNNVDDYIRDVDIVAYNYTSDYHGKVLTGFADFMRTLRSQTGFFGFILLPMIIFFFYAIIRVVISSMDYKKVRSIEETEELERKKQEEIEAAVSAALASQRTDSMSEESTPVMDIKGSMGLVPSKSNSDSAYNMTPEEIEQFRQFQAFQKMQNAAKEAHTKPADTEE